MGDDYCKQSQLRYEKLVCTDSDAASDYENRERTEQN
jgi:hypothetical protein